MLAQSYIAYLLISIAITIWVGRTLSKNGLVFLIENFNNNAALANSVNHLLLVGFYLINLGFIAFTLKSSEHPATLEESIEFLSGKIGFIIIVLGIMHFFNMGSLMKMRNFKKIAPVQDVITEGK